MRKMILLFFTAAMISCHKEKPDVALTEFSDDFESYTSASDLVTTDNLHWTEYNVNEVNVAGDTISLDTTIVHSGRQSVRFHCAQNDPAMTDVCKCNLNKGGLYFKQGETFYYSGWYYVQRPAMDYGTFFVMDLEEVANGSPGVRVMAWEENLEFERNKLGWANVFQSGDVTLFPVNRWTHLELEVKLSQYRHGGVKMWLDGKLLLEKDKIVTLPKDRLNVQWKTKGYYDRVQVGITAKNGTQDLVLYVDDVEMRKK